jgi:hypothetical protein
MALSDLCKGMILVPGTVAWRKPFVRSGPKQISSKTGLAKATSRYDKAISTRNARDSAPIAPCRGS